MLDAVNKALLCFTLNALDIAGETPAPAATPIITPVTINGVESILVGLVFDDDPERLMTILVAPTQSMDIRTLEGYHQLKAGFKTEQVKAGNNPH
jgi:hypothetical protein